MADDFAVHLGAGSYLDSSGKLVFGPPTGAQIYQPPGGFRLDTKKIQEAFKDLSGLLPKDEDAKKKWMTWGVPKDVVNFLGSIAGVAGIVATAISVYVWAIGILITLMDIMVAEEGLSPEMGRVLSGLKTQMLGAEQIARAELMIGIHSQFDGRIDRIHGILTGIAIENPVGAARAARFNDMLAIVNELAVPMSNLRNQGWATTYDAEVYKGRGFAASLLVFHRSDGTLPPVPMHSPTVTAFDYRLGVPMLLYGATTYVALLQAAMPWFRSAGMHAATLRKTADAIDKFVLRMQDECLSRTQYTAEQVLQQRIWAIYDIANPASSGPRYDMDGPIAVGAFDLVAYNDPFLFERWLQQFQAGADTAQRGLFNYRWWPPPQAVTLDDIAAAANEQSKQDYANMQTATGMFRLISTAAWLRFLTTPPLRSQTVSGNSMDTRSLVDEKPTTAKSPRIFPNVVIEEPATLKRYNARCNVRITTQLPGYTPQFQYRVVLKTLDCTYGNEAWTDRAYVGDVWQPEYVATAGDPRCKRLKTSVRSDRILQEIELHHGPSPAPGVNVPIRRQTLRATTFDWYVPVFTPWSSYVDPSAQYVKAVAASAGGNSPGSLGTGGVSLHLMGRNAVAPPMLPLMGKPSRLAATVSVDDALDFIDLVTLNDVSLDKAERRHVKVEDVEIEWHLAWSDGRLEVRVYGLPQFRPFQFYIVVEETVYSGEHFADAVPSPLADGSLREQIHTAIGAEMVTQLVFVPERFFTREREAIAAAARMIDDFNRRFAESERPGPGDPIEFVQRAIRESITASPSTATFVQTIDRQVEFAERHAPQLWESVVRDRIG